MKKETNPDKAQEITDKTLKNNEKKEIKTVKIQWCDLKQGKDSTALTSLLNHGRKTKFN